MVGMWKQYKISISCDGVLLILLCCERSIDVDLMFDVYAELEAGAYTQGK
jgi:hypothetical protein